jgi:DNA repair photolyase
MTTKILKPSGTSFEWCINQYDGCAHGCRYCYGMVIRRKKYENWIEAKPRSNVLEFLHRDIQKLKKNNTVIKDIFVGSVTDSYQPLEEENSLTRQILEVLMENELPFTILTKSDLVLRDIDLFKHYKWCRIGATITSLDESFRRTLEPFSASYEKRIRMLKILKDNSISTYLSCEPIFPVKEANPIEIVKELGSIVDLFEFGMWNKYCIKNIPEYYYANYSDDYYVGLFKEIIQFCEKQKINYCLASHSRKFVEEHGLPFRAYPFVKA